MVHERYRRQTDSGAVLTNRHTGHVPIFNISEGPQVAVSDANFSNYDFCYCDTFPNTSSIIYSSAKHNNYQELHAPTGAFSVMNIESDLLDKIIFPWYRSYKAYFWEFRKIAFVFFTSSSTAAYVITVNVIKNFLK